MLRIHEHLETARFQPTDQCAVRGQVPLEARLEPFGQRAR